MIPIYQVNQYLFINLNFIADIALSSPPMGRHDVQLWTLTMCNSNKHLITPEEAANLAAVLGSINHPRNPDMPAGRQHQ